MKICFLCFIDRSRESNAVYILSPKPSSVLPCVVDFFVYDDMPPLKLPFQDNLFRFGAFLQKDLVTIHTVRDSKIKKAAVIFKPLHKLRL